ncbi:hypothetical protein QTI51_23085 [Variovorax sp. J22G73]|uniref:hypothetical protein n=1 Tax=unclassified Variovorax TaxID=663243 RepID=UPI002575A43B|nr:MULTISPECIES: hypothetical protein [unclassified Variovorax]MDM0007455.1 hypothetical protein [Variovorax sp. J22R203]MDM0100186.1 hypothetical protein [Variovorax sp. J22G73]
MDGKIICLGEDRQWCYAIEDICEVDGVVSVSAAIYLLGAQRCRLVMSHPAGDREKLVEAMQLKCVEWIDIASLTAAQFDTGTAGAESRLLTRTPI